MPFKILKRWEETYSYCHGDFTKAKYEALEEAWSEAIRIGTELEDYQRAPLIITVQNMPEQRAWMVTLVMDFSGRQCEQIESDTICQENQPRA